MERSDAAKDEIIAKYESEAREKSKESKWLREGVAYTPEGAAARYFVRRKVTEALKLAGPRLGKDARVMEIGCNVGYMTALLAQKFTAVTAVDIVPAAISLARERLRNFNITNVRFVADDAERLNSIPDNEYDAIFSFSTLRYCPRVHEAMNAVYRKLAKGGMAILDFPNAFSPWHLLVKALCRIKPHIHDHLYALGGVRDLFIKAGFSVENSKTFLFTYRHLPAPLLPMSKAADAVLERLPLVRSCGAIIMMKGVKK